MTPSTTTYREYLVLRRDAIVAELASLTSTSMGGKANVKDRDGGTTVDHVGYRMSLLEELAKINDAIKDAQNVEDMANGGDYTFEFDTMYEP